MTAIIFPGSGSRPSRRRTADPAAAVTYEQCERWLVHRLVCVDERSASPDPVLRALVADTLADLRALGSLDADLEDVMLGALASIEVAFEVQAAAGGAASLAS